MVADFLCLLISATSVFYLENAREALPATLLNPRSLRLQAFIYHLNGFVQGNPVRNLQISELSNVKNDVPGKVNPKTVIEFSTRYSRLLSIEASHNRVNGRRSVSTLDNASKSTNFSTNIQIESKPPKIDDFRSREEQKEQNYEKQEQNQQQETPHGNEGNEQVEMVRNEILDASLQFVQSYGWSRKAIACGAESKGYPGAAHGMFPNGPIELIHHFYNKCNEELIKKLKEETKNGEQPAKETLDFLVRAVQFRLQLIEPYISVWPQALAIMSLPRNVPTSLAQLLTLADDVCYYAGDRSVDFGWYTRRIGLASIFKITELYMLQDSSVEHQQTWTFLRNRMEESAHLEGIFLQSEGLTQNVQKTLNSAFITARNILGMNYDRR